MHAELVRLLVVVGAFGALLAYLYLRRRRQEQHRFPHRSGKVIPFARTPGQRARLRRSG